MTLIPFLPSHNGRWLLAASALAMTATALVTVQVDTLCGYATGVGPGMPLVATLSLIPIAMAGLGLSWWRTERRQTALMAAMRAREVELLQHAEHDSLTGLRNRLALKQDVERLLARPGLHEQAILLLDLDRFKFINDTLGHDAGDDLLISLARRLEALLRPGDCLYRLGGDEFVILLDEPGTDEDVTRFCRRVEAETFRPHDLAKGRVATGVSIGVTFLRDDDGGLSASLKRADLALYRAKALPGSAHVFFDASLAAQSLARIELERDLSRAIADDEFFLEYQPIMGVESGAIRSLEALVRWRHPQKGVLPPQEFVPLAEASGMIVQLGRQVLRKACLEAAKWPSPMGVAVNVAGDQFKDLTFVGHVRSCLAEAGLAPGRLTIEVTESLFTIDANQLIQHLTELRNMGVRIALDDFGTGFSSINNLKTFPLDQLKIDRSFTRAMLADKRDADLVDLITRLGDTFQVSTTIEGIETEGQLDFVRGLGVAEAQGFLISRPLPADGVATFLLEHRSWQPGGVEACV